MADETPRPAGPKSQSTANVPLAPPNPMPGSAVNPTGAGANVRPAVPAQPGAAPATDPNAPKTFSPYTGPTDIIPGGCYRQNTKMRGDKQYGGRIADANGVILATFDDKQENTGNPLDGKLTDEPGEPWDGKRWAEKHKELVNELAQA
jgi:hypothetical protein